MKNQYLPRSPRPTGPDWALAKTGIHLISKRGEVYGLFRHRYLQPSAGKSGGYLSVSGGKWRPGSSVKVQRLVMEAFVGPQPEGTQIRHLNGNPRDNRLENLAYGTPAENRADVQRHGRDPQATKTECVNGHPFSETNTYRRPKGGRSCRACLHAARIRFERKAAA